MKKLTILILIIVLIFSLNSCKEVDTYIHEKVEATIVDTQFKLAWVQIIPSGKTMMTVPHAAQYNVYFEYEGHRLHVDSKEVYDEIIENKLTKYTVCKLTTTYTDGTSDTRLEMLTRCQ